ncbi:hypothetical protein [Nostoc sp.]|uniref:hypothetical protein n=1 Tax=Nostoc sp. TaxID=1180 RepID=UPI002FFCBCFE
MSVQSSQSWKYYHFVIYTISGYSTRELEESKTFFYEQFPQVKFPKTTNRDIQTKLIDLLRGSDQTMSNKARKCLDCYIGNQLVKSSETWAKRFGKEYDFTAIDLLFLVIKPEPSRIPHSSNSNQADESIKTKILLTFDVAKKTTLSGWTDINFKGYAPVKKFLLKLGFKYETDWYLLVKTSPNYLKNILIIADRTDTEINQAVALHNSFLIFYKETLKARPLRCSKPFHCPSDELLDKIFRQLEPNWITNFQNVKPELQKLAASIRKNKEHKRNSHRQPMNEKKLILSYNSDLQDILDNFKQPLMDSLVKGVKEKIEYSLEYKHKRNQNPEQWFEAIKLFYCEGMTQAEIASKMRFTDQPGLSRLLDLRKFREDIARKSMAYFRESVLELTSRGSAQFSALDSRLENSLPCNQVENISYFRGIMDEIMREDEIASKRCGQNRNMKSLLAQAIRDWIKTMGN